MQSPQIGWQTTTPVPDLYAFNAQLKAEGGRLLFEGIPLIDLFRPNNPLPTYPSPLEGIYLPAIGRAIQTMCDTFARARAKTKYEGDFLYFYASKANASEEVISKTVKSGAHHEMSSWIDTEIVRALRKVGRLPDDRLVLCNGFKPAGSRYAQEIVALQQERGNLIPILEDWAELPAFRDSPVPFAVGLRHKTYGRHQNGAEMESADSRFGFSSADLLRVADEIATLPHLSLTMYHGMVGSQLTDSADFVTRLTPPLEMYAQLRQRHPTLRYFNFGGGVPAPLTLDFHFNYDQWAESLLQRAQEVCDRYNVPVPHIVGEFGRYTVTEQGFHLFQVINIKQNNSPHPYYIIDGSIMTSFPDIWAIGEHFICLPLNHLDQPFQRAKLGGITCDSDDTYPMHNSSAALYLPIPTPDEPLYIGFFSVGAYQEMLGGVKGTKHCVLPEAVELILDSQEGAITFTRIEGQTSADVLRNLGYHS